MLFWNKVLCFQCTMCSWMKILLILFMVCSCHCKIFRVAWISPDKSSGQEINTFTSVAALKLALATVMTNPMLLNGHSVEVDYFPTDCTSHGSMQAAMTAKTSNPDVIIGPPCQEGMKMVAQLCAYWNLPVFTWHTPGIEFDSASTYPTLVRMIPSLSTMGMSLLHLCRQNKWSEFAFVYDSSWPWTLYEEAVRATVPQTEVRMLSTHVVNSTIPDAALVKMFTHIKKYSWIVVFACPSHDIRRYLLAAEQAGMAFGNHVFIQLDHQLYPEQTLNSDVLSKQRWKRGDAKDQIAKRAYQSLIHILLDSMNDDAKPTHPFPQNRYSEFIRMAPGGSSLQIPGWKLPPGGQPDVYSLYLYDAVLMWSVLAEKLHNAGKNHQDGTLVAQEARNFLADGASGYLAMNENLDRLGKLFILYMESNGMFKPSQILKFNSTNGYEIINLKPLQEQLRYHGGQAKYPVGSGAVTTATARTTILVKPAATKPTPPSKKPHLPITALPKSKHKTYTTAPKLPVVKPTKPSIPYPTETLSKNIALTVAPTGQSSDYLIKRLLAKVQALEKSIQQHEIHAHKHIPDHTHTPHPIIARVSPTPVPSYPGQQTTLANNKPIGQVNIPHVPAPIQPKGQIQSVNGQATHANDAYIYQGQHGGGHLHWHPDPHYPQPVHGHQDPVPGPYPKQVHSPTTHRPPPPRPPPTPTAASHTTTTVPPTTTLAATTASVGHGNAVNGNMDEAMINRLSSRIVDHLTGTPSNGTSTNNGETRIVNDWVRNSLEDLPQSLLLALQDTGRRGPYQQQGQGTHNNQNIQQQPRTARNNQNQVYPHQAPGRQWRPPQDPLTAVFDSLLWDVPPIW